MSISKLAAVFLLLYSVVSGSSFSPSDSVHTCSYFITSEPSNARVFINDSLCGQTPLRLFNFPRLSFSLRIKSDKDTNWVMAVKAQERNEISIHALLDKTYSILNVHSDPEGASIFVNDSLRGKTPLDDLRVNDGLTTVKLVREGCLQKEETFYIPKYSHHRHDLNIKLKSPLSSLDLSALGKYSNIVFEGKQINQKVPASIVIPAGEHFISAEDTKKNEKLALDFISEGEFHYTIITKKKFQSTPLVLSIFVPGLGQAYDGSLIKGLSLMGGFLGLGAAAYLTADDFSQKKGLYNLRMDKYLASENETDALANKKLMMQTKDDMDKASGPKNLTLGLLAGAYIYNLIDVLLFHSVKDFADLKKMQELNGLSWQLGKDKMSVGMKFNF
ncbi:MAG TPA: PEGA domain-containing protein [Ignavibacteriales bacterium]|nr:PEGA domain-containing protein [Ignavibacteriales bacterium]